MKLLLLYFLGAAACARWLWVAFEMWRGWRGRPSLAEVPDPPGAALPRLSVIVPALNEEETAEAAMRTLLALDYPDLEIIAVDDRSTDRTGAILDRLSAEDPRLKVIHVKELPAGWLGKTHAMHLGSASASAPWLLFTDADIHFEPSALRRAVAWAEREKIDHLVVLPENVAVGVTEKLFMAFFWVAFAIRQRAWEVSDPDSDAHIGVGAFNLVRAEAYARAGGHAAMKMEVLDDVKLGKRLKETGARQDCLPSQGMVSLRWHVGLRGIVHGLTKNTFAALEYSLPRTLWVNVQILAGMVWPAIGLFVGPWGSRALCAGAIAGMVAALASVPRARPVHPIYALGYPAAALLMLYIIDWSMFRTYAQGGVVWRGTHYDLEELRRGVV